MANNQVNHPKHYNQHPAGIECISIIRNYTCDIANALKYLWRAGLKFEMGKDDVVKEVEDLKKALWYIEDYQNSPRHHIAECKPELMDSYIKDHHLDDVNEYEFEIDKRLMNSYNNDEVINPPKEEESDVIEDKELRNTSIAPSRSITELGFDCEGRVYFVLSI